MANRLPRKGVNSASKLGAKAAATRLSNSKSFGGKFVITIVVALAGFAGAAYYGFTLALLDSGYESAAQAAKINVAVGCSNFAAEGSDSGLGLSLADPMLDLSRLARPDLPEGSASMSGIGWRLSDISNKCIQEAAKAKPGESELIVESALTLAALSQRLAASSGDELLLKLNMRSFSDVAKVSKALYAPADSFKAFARREAARRIVECSVFGHNESAGTLGPEVEPTNASSACPGAVSWALNAATWPITGPTEDELARSRLDFGGKRNALLMRLWIVAEPWSSLGSDSSKKNPAFEGEFAKTAQWSSHLDFGSFKSWLKNNGLEAALASHDASLSFGKVGMAWDEKKAVEWAPVMALAWNKIDYEVRLKKTLETMSSSGAVNPQDSLANRTAAAVEFMDKARDASMKALEAKLDAGHSDALWPNWRSGMNASKCFSSSERGLLNGCREDILVFAKPTEPCFGRMVCESLVSRIVPGGVFEGVEEPMACPAKSGTGARGFVDLRGTMRTGKPICVSRVIESMADSGSCFARGNDRPCWYASGEVGVGMPPETESASR